jgi:hypothetical protein
MSKKRKEKEEEPEELKVQLYKSIIECLERHTKSEKDILWVGSDDGSLVLTWQEFAPMAQNIYVGKHSYFVHLIPYNLVVVGKDWYLERIHGGRDNDEEQWKFRVIPKVKEISSSFVLKKIENNDDVYEFLKMKGE